MSAVVEQRGVEAARAARAGHAWWPGLEGLRGIALLTVFVYHQNETVVPGGYLSVSLFFTLSGFLITSLVLREYDRTGTLDLKRFWSRRVRRLLAIAMTGLVLAALVARASRGATLLPPVADDIRWAALNLANWRFIHTNTSYAAALTKPSPVTHYWSLAIEEQYYLVYPVLALLALRWGRRGLGGMLVGLTALSLMAQILVGGGDRAYFGTDTRLAELAIGGLVAVLWTPKVREAIGRRRIDGMAALAGVGVAALWWKMPIDSPRLWHGGMLVHSLLACVLVVGAIEGGVITRLTSLRPAVWLGGLSYTCYVVHFPLFVYLDHDRTHLAGVELWALRVVTSIVLAWGLRVAIERPVRFGKAFTRVRWEAPLAAVTALAIVLVAATALPHVGRPDTPLEVAFGGGLSTRTSPVPEVHALPSAPPSTTSSTVVTVPSRSAPAPSGRSPGVPTAAPGTSSPTTQPAERPRALKLLMAGDSTAGVWADGIQRWAASNGYASVDRVGGPGCVLHQEGLAAIRMGWLYEPNPGCVLLGNLIVQQAKQDGADAIVLMIGSIQLSDWVATASAVPTSLLDPAYAARYASTFAQVLDELSTALSIPILVATVPGPRWVPESSAPGTGPLTMNSVERAQRLNAINAAVVATHPRVRMVPFAAAVSDKDGWVDLSLHPDGLHIDPNKVPHVLDAGLEAQLRDAYQSIVRALPVLRRQGATIWWP